MATAFQLTVAGTILPQTEDRFGGGCIDDGGGCVHDYDTGEESALVVSFYGDYSQKNQKSLVDIPLVMQVRSRFSQASDKVFWGSHRASQGEGGLEPPGGPSDGCGRLRLPQGSIRRLRGGSWTYQGVYNIPFTQGGLCSWEWSPEPPSRSNERQGVGFFGVTCCAPLP
eukprot:1175706-Prorocentrum_minimum.AAC.4